MKNRKLVMVAVSDPDRRHEVAAALTEAFGAWVLPEADGAGVARMVAHVRPALVFLDLDRGEAGDGAVSHLCRRIKEDPALVVVPVVVASARAADPAWGCDGALDSGYQARELVDLAGRWLASER